jgi:hypothetical protein
MTERQKRDFAAGESDLDVRVLEGLPWLALTCIDMDWDWPVQNAKLHHRQNRLGFVVSLASELAEGKNDVQRSSKLRKCLEVLERVRLSDENTFCHDSMTQAERACVRERRSPTAARWNLLTDMKAEQLSYPRGYFGPISAPGCSFLLFRMLTSAIKRIGHYPLIAVILIKGRLFFKTAFIWCRDCFSPVDSPHKVFLRRISGGACAYLHLRSRAPACAS